MPTDFSRICPVVEQVADAHDVAPAHLPAVEPDLGGEQVEAALDGEARLVDAEAAHRAAGRIVGVGGDRLDRERRHPVGPAGVAGGAFQHLAADRGVGAGIAKNVDLGRGQPAFGVAADRVGHGQRMALGMHADRFLAAELDPHRPAGHTRQQRGLRLDRHVLLAAERRRRWARVRRTARSSGSPSTEAIWRRSSKMPWLWLTMCRRPSGSGTARHASGSRNRCSMRCVVQTPLTTCADAASAASTSPRA